MTINEKALAVAERYWQLMKTNDFRSVGSVLSDDFVIEWPQSTERILGRDNYAAMNEEYPAHGRWEFQINRVVGNDIEVVTDVSVTDGVQNARAISFFTIRDGKIVKIVEFWPEPFAARADRKHLVQMMESEPER